MAEQETIMKYQYLGIQCIISGITLTKLNSYITKHNLSDKLNVAEMGGFYYREPIVPIAKGNMSRIDWLTQLKVNTKVYADFSNTFPYALSSTDILPNYNEINIKLNSALISFIANAHSALEPVLENFMLEDIPFIRANELLAADELFVHLYSEPVLCLLVNPVKLVVYNDKNSVSVL